jgi:hypothetical protein
LFALNSILEKSFIKKFDFKALDGQGDAVDVLNKIVNIIEMNIISIINNDDVDLFYACLIRLLSSNVGFALKIKNIEQEKKEKSIKNVAIINENILKMFELWKILSKTITNKYVLNESLQFLVYLNKFTIDDENNEVEYAKLVFEIFKQEILLKKKLYSYGVLNNFFSNCLQRLCLKFPKEATTVIIYFYAYYFIFYY